ncbi:MAG: endopeptidase La, partial [Candidatus Pacebacteria bacterium]|nr:endopeptidase La [Candidatus Paceibacterota bacterium]MBT6756590.1 endopeptidase La [Candidatus Paceibacterota bacterium]
NKEFVDHYLDIPFDLSQTIFITTANSLDTIPPALRDRLEIIHYSGYTPEEKFNIAQKHLLTKVIEANGLEKSNIEIPATVIEAIIASYTREAGVRNLERTLHTLSRKAAKELVLHPRKKKISITTKNLKKLLGPKKYDEGLAEKRNMIGAATGLAWTSVGGDVLFVEVALTPGKGKIQLTGQLGDVMKESAQAAFTYVKSNLKSLKIPFSKVQKTDIHIHVPEGAVPKDGPSAGVTLSTAIVSALTKIPVKRTVAMTGETTLRGKVLRIGGLKEKTIAAHRAGITTVIIPKENKRDLEKIPDSVKKAITFKPVSSIKEVLEIALTKAI